MSHDQLHDDLQGLMRKVLDGIAEMEVVREEVEEYGRTPYEPMIEEPPPRTPAPTLSELEEDDVYRFKKF